MTNQNVLVKTEEKEVSFVPFGATDKVKLTVAIIQNLIAVKTRSGKTCSTQDAYRFMALCQAQRLNPFAGDAFLIGYDAQDGAKFSLITAHQAFLKRAETCEDFDGMLSGVIIDNDGKIEEREGDFHLKDENVVGGWARVYHKKRKYVTYRRIRMERFNKGFAQWKEDPAGMVVKCAEADALRSTFPTLLGGLYTQGEIIDISARRTEEPLEMPSHRLVAVSSEPVQPETPAGGESQPSRVQTEAIVGEQAEIASIVTQAGHTFDDLVKFLETEYPAIHAKQPGGFDELTKADAKLLIRAKGGILDALAAAKKGQP